MSFLANSDERAQTQVSAGDLALLGNRGNDLGRDSRAQSGSCLRGPGGTVLLLSVGSCLEEMFVRIFFIFCLSLGTFLFSFYRENT